MSIIRHLTAYQTEDRVIFMSLHVAHVINRMYTHSRVDDIRYIHPK